MIKATITVPTFAMLAFVDEQGAVLRLAELGDLASLLNRMADKLWNEAARLSALDSASAAAAELRTSARRLEEASHVVVSDWNHDWRPFDDLELQASLLPKDCPQPAREPTDKT